MNKLYIVGTPIGNMGDISKRAVETLASSEAIITENQNTAKKLFSLLNIPKADKHFLTVAEFNDSLVVQKAIDFINQHNKTSLITEAGTPLISDPGYKIISVIREQNLDIDVTAVPGVSSVTTHLSVSGLPTDKFMFIGFLPKSGAKKQNILKKLKDINKILKTTFVIFESKYKIIQTLEQIAQQYPDCKVSLANDLTKMYEKVYYGNIQSVLNNLKQNPVKGEFVMHLQLNGSKRSTHKKDS